jgi:hypothetical protein
MVSALPVYIIADCDAKLSMRHSRERGCGLSVSYLSADQPLVMGYMQIAGHLHGTGAASESMRKAGDCVPVRRKEMIAPEVGQIVRLADYEEKLVVKSLSADESAVELVTMDGSPCGQKQVPVTELLPGEDLSAG